MNVQKMTGLELAKIEADETHPLHAQACDEIDRRNEDVTGCKSEVGLMDEPWPDYDDVWEDDIDLHDYGAGPYCDTDPYYDAMDYDTNDDFLPLVVGLPTPMTLGQLLASKSPR